ncbi:ABC transporter [Lachnospiraceae bacterium oral taxon 500]|nr:ABC transporter [Lachnospiraceae bacterium oral taxon 500]
MLLSVKDLSFAYIEDWILKDLSCHINENEKIALIGNNGAGKTTLFKILTGELAPAAGQIYQKADLRLGYLAQNAEFESVKTLYDELYSANAEIVSLEKKLARLNEQMAAPANDEETQLRIIHEYDELHQRFDRLSGYSYKSFVHGILRGLGFEEDRFNQPVATLSGGQKTRLALAKLLLQKPDLLLLDEPTNHLDLKAITWLENFLAEYQGALFIISHDRYFLDKVVNRVFELSFGQLDFYEGNYSYYLEQREIRQELAEKAYLNQQKEIDRQQNIIDTLRARNREKFVRRAESREKLLNKIERLEKPLTENEAMHISFAPKQESGHDVLALEHISKAFGELTLFQDLNYSIFKGDRIALVGENGSGKTTLFRILQNELTPDSGTVRLGKNVQISYYDQEHSNLNPNNSLFDEISNQFPKMTNTEIRNLLAAFLFTGDDVFQKISSLSGGEKGRLSLAKMMLAEGNFLLLDEPTNHLDLVSREVLENALVHYSGTILFISHDRYFINRIATRVAELENLTLTEYLGNYDDFITKKSERQNPVFSGETTPARPASFLDLAPSNRIEPCSGKAESRAKKDWLLEKEEKARSQKRISRQKKLEEMIDQTEQRITELDLLLASEEVFTNYEKAHEISMQKEQLEEKLLGYYEELDELM